MVLRIHIPCHQCYVKSPNSRFHCDSINLINLTGIQPLPPLRTPAGLVQKTSLGRAGLVVPPPPAPTSVPSADFIPQV